VARLPDIVACGRRKVSESINIFLNPQEALYRFVRRIAQNAYENTEFSVGDTEKSPPERPGASPDSVRKIEQRIELHEESSDRTKASSKSIEEAAKNAQKEIKSHWNRYILEREPLNPGEKFPIYRAKKNNSDTYVQVKEYTLPERILSEKEISHYHYFFGEVIHQNHKLTHSPDFRLVKLLDGIYDRKSNQCYLVTKPFEDTVALKDYLNNSSNRMDAFQIREVLRQVLETLHFLHNACWIDFPSVRQIKGIPHANLSLNSLLLRSLKNSNAQSGKEFFVYVTNLGLWEHLFLPPGPEQFYTSSKLEPDESHLNALKQKDLQALCHIAHQLAEREMDKEGNPKDFSPDFCKNSLKDEYLGEYLWDLWNKRFPSAQEALEALSVLELPEVSYAEPEFKEEEIQKGFFAGSDWLIPTLVLLFLGFGVGSYFATETILGRLNNPKNNNPEVASKRGNLLIKDVGFTNSIKYGIEDNSAWETAMNRLDAHQIPREDSTGNTSNFPALMSLFYSRHQENRQTTSVQTESSGDSSQKDPNSADQAQQGSTGKNGGTPKEPDPPKTLELVSLSDSLKDYPDLSHQIEKGSLHVGLVERLPSEVLPGVENQFSFEPVAYDGLAIFVPFGDAYRSRNSIGKLGHKISLTDLRRLYTGSTDKPQFRGQTVKLFFPNDETVINLFKALVLNNDPALISRFNALHESAIARDAKAYPNAARSDDQTAVIRNNIYEKILYEFEKDETIGIGFDRLSYVYNQCSVYPLAISNQDSGARMRRYQSASNRAIQPLKQSGGQPIKPTTDLCNAKGSYWLEISEAYPLQVELGVLFRSDSKAGQEFLAMLNTVEGQLLLSQAGLVPKTISIENIWQEVWGDKK
jgi:serine/threonine protein kinase